jgi:hypothetical protein
MTDGMYARESALAQAVQTHHADSHPQARAILATADTYLDWLTQPVALTLAFGTPVDRGSGRPAPTTGDDPMANLELGDNQQVVATAVALDAGGQPTTDTLTWTASASAAVSLTPSADTMSCTIDGLVPTPGVVITATDTLGNTTTGELDVVGGPATTLSLQFGPVTTRTPAPATAETPATSA